MAALITQAPPESLNLIRTLWEDLNEHHRDVSIHFSPDFAANSWQRRQSQLLQLAEQGELGLFLAREQDGGEPCGYCVATVDAGNTGEIQSIFVLPSHRGQGLGEKLLQAALAWLDTLNAHPITIGVVHGNERAWALYERFGFKPRLTTLYKK